MQFLPHLVSLPALPLLEAIFKAHRLALVLPPLETVRIPFEGKEIIGNMRLPKGVRPAPLVLTITSGDTRKEDSADADRQ